MTNSDSVFERVLHSVGDDGKFQKRSNLIFNFLLAAMATMSYMNLILAATVPDHWCQVPGREEGNFSMDEWKLLTLPRQVAHGSRVKNYRKLNNIASCQKNFFF